MKKPPKILLLLETSRKYGRGLLRGITRYAFLNGPWIMERETPFYIKSGKDVRMTVDPTRWDVDGIIMREQKYADKVLQTGIPVIFASYLKKYISQTSCIMSDDMAIGEMAASYLLERGFRNFAYLGFKDMYWSENRKRGFIGTIAKNNCNVHIFKQARSKVDRLWANEQFRVADWLRSLPKPLGLMGCNDDRGLQAVNSARIASLRVPEDVAVVGVDDDDFVCNLASPPLSSVALNVEEVGYQAAELLDKLMSGKKIKPKKIPVNPTYVVTRRSSDIFAINDKEVADAVSFIYEHAKEPIQIIDVAEAVGISRRGLYDKFRRTLNCSVSDYINRVRIDLTARWLIHTNMTISQIALKLGFSSPDHIAQYFRKHKGINPSEFRRRYHP